MQVSRMSSYEEMNRIKIADVQKPLGKTGFDKLLDKLQVDNLSEDEKELFLSIMFDRKISQEEFEKLSYEDVNKLKQLTYKSDLEGNAIAESFVVYEDFKFAPYLAASDISDDEDYNKAIFNTLKKLNLTQEEGISFINEFGGSIDSEEKRDFENRLSSSQYDSGVRYKTYIGEDMQQLILNRLSELSEGLSVTSDNLVKKDYEKLIHIYTLVQSEYTNINLEKKSQVEQYTRNTKPNPIYNNEVISLYKQIEEKYDNRDKKEFEELLTILDIDNLSKEEKELFRTILEDEEFSNIEMDSLSFEQMKKISQLISQKDSNGNFIDETSIRYSSKTSALLSTINATNDEEFNRALFDIVKQMSDINKINEFLLPFINHVSEKFKEFGNTAKLNMDDVVDELIGKFKSYYEESEDIEIKEHYTGMINMYSDFKVYYNELKKG